MQSLEKRISALERANFPEEEIMLIVWTGSGEVGMEINHISDGATNHWDRLTNETEKAFIERAASETPRTGRQIAVHFGTWVHSGSKPPSDHSRSK